MKTLPRILVIGLILTLIGPGTTASDDAERPSAMTRALEAELEDTERWIEFYEVRLRAAKDKRRDILEALGREDELEPRRQYNPFEEAEKPKFNPFHRRSVVVHDAQGFFDLIPREFLAHDEPTAIARNIELWSREALYGATLVVRGGDVMWVETPSEVDAEFRIETTWSDFPIRVHGSLAARNRAELEQTRAALYAGTSWGGEVVSVRVSEMGWESLVHVWIRDAHLREEWRPRG